MSEWSPEACYATASRPPAEVAAPRRPDEAPVPAPRPASSSLPPIDECGEPLVACDDLVVCCNCYRAAGWPGTHATTWLRSGALARLVAVHDALPDGFGIAVFDAWRSPTTIRALWDHYYGPGSTLEPGFLANPDGAGVPPHLTGGAVDVTLTWAGTPLSLGTPFDEFSDRAHLRSLEADGPEPDRSLRRLLHRAMTAEGFAPFDQEWWHYSWGDQDWATHHDEPAARYGETHPDRR